MVQGQSLIVFNVDTMVGEAIVRELLDPQHRQHLSQQFSHIFGTVRDLAHSGDLAALGVCLVQLGDNPDERKLSECLKNCQISTCILAPDCGSERFIDQGKRIIKASKDAGIERFALLSHIGIDDAQNELARWFTELEQCFKKGGFSSAAIVRHAPLIQSLFMYRKMLEQGKLQWPLKEDVRFTQISLRDVANFVVYELLESDRLRRRTSEPQMFKLTGTQVQTPKDICQLFERILGERIEYQQIDRQKYEQYLKNEVGLPNQIVKLMVEEKDLAMRGKLNFVSDDHKKSTGKDPVKVDQWLQKHKELFRRNQ